MFNARKEMKKLEKEDFWDGFCKVFKVIGLAFAAVGSIATTAVGVMSGNPALIAAGVVGAVMTIDGIVSVATDGQYSIAAGFTALGKSMGMSDDFTDAIACGSTMIRVGTAIFGRRNYNL